MSKPAGAPNRISEASEDDISSDGVPAADHATPVDDHDPVGGLLGLGEIVRGDEHGHPVGGEVAHDLSDELASGHVDAGGRLVEKGDLRSSDQGEGQREALLLAPRELAPQRVAPVRQADTARQFVGCGRVR